MSLCAHALQKSGLIQYSTDGLIPGPRIVASGPGISITGGHGDLNNYAPEVSKTLFPEKNDFEIADGPDLLLGDLAIRCLLGTR